ncbi:ImmA/IrrE family metallo-endopeptidase [Trueperella sp.]|uniref:ImmA/IrrE family metallo-endopeptidase n=1 Tax=Trueperella sp. TaxID=2699835 RepID=UPI0039C8941A
MAHEYVHATLGHDGPQEARIEARVDRRAARLLVSPADYVLAEHLYGCDVVAIAEELGVPVWVVAYREGLRCDTQTTIPATHDIGVGCGYS